jgi:beta-glucosidase
VSTNPADERRIDEILARMTVEEKVGQLIQPDIATVRPSDVGRYHIGSILNGGNSAPNRNETAPAAEWLKLADAFWEASMEGGADRPKVPIMWGADAVHGHSNIVGATIFPHNIGLGAARNPDLIRRIGEITALEMVVTGMDWDFSPTLAVVRDDRWGRTYEGFSEDPEIVRSYAGPMVEGLQGKAGTKEFLGPGKVIATAKHFIGDGGTLRGKDQGDNPSSDVDLKRVHGAGYPPAVEAGVQSIMASFSSVRGEKVHGSHRLMTGVIKDELGFDGLIVGDWDAHAQVPGCRSNSCPQSINAGLDIFMAPNQWRALYSNTVAQAKSGEIPMARLDDAVRRILRVKIRAGLFEKGKPSSRPYAGRFELLGSPEHRAVARQAVRESLVLLKNNGKILPLSGKADILVAGDGADDIGKQSGGWSITWQGTGVTNKDFPNGQSIFSGIAEAVRRAGGTATLAVDGAYSRKPDAAIVVFGEEPYAEGFGDRTSVEYSPGEKKDLALLRRLKAAGIPVVAVFLSGRPMWVNGEINAADAFVAAFLPGTEGGGVADVLIRKPDGRVNHDFKGKLSYSWPKRPDQTPLNRGDAQYDPLFAYGYGLSYASAVEVPQLSEDLGPAAVAQDTNVFLARGAPPRGFTLALEDRGEAAVIRGSMGMSPAGRLLMKGVDRDAQEDARRFDWSSPAPASVSISSPAPMDLSGELARRLSLVIGYRVDLAPTGKVSLAMRCGGGCEGRTPVTASLKAAPLGEWRSLAVPLSCFAKGGADLKRIDTPFLLEAAGAFSVSISDVRIARSEPTTACEPAP